LNVLLFDAADEVAPGRVRVADRRLRHAREVLGARLGDELSVGRIGGRLGRGTVARIVRLSAEQRKILIACGAAAGIATTFNAPIGALMFAHEIVLLGELHLADFTLVVIATTVAVIASRGIFAMARDRCIPAPLARVSRRHGTPLGATLFVVGAAVATLLINQFWTGLFALPQTPHYFALFAWGSTFGGFALVVVYLLMSVGALRSFAQAEGRVRIILSAVIGILITVAAIFGSFYKVTAPTIYAPWFALGLLVIGFASTWVLKARQAASTQLADLGAEGSA